MQRFMFKAPKKVFEISPLAPTPVGFNEEELQDFLQEKNVSLEAFRLCASRFIFGFVFMEVFFRAALHVLKGGPSSSSKSCSSSIW